MVPLDEVCLDINAGTKETYEKVMPPLKWDTVIKNAQEFVKIYKITQKEGNIYINFVKHDFNKDEAKELQKLFPDIVIYDRYWATNRAGEHMDVKVPKDAFTRLSEFGECIELETNLPILYDGTTLLCCFDWRRRAVIGNVKDTHVLDLWHSPKKHKFYDICKVCK